MMAFSKEDRERGVTSGELVSCAPAPDREGELYGLLVSRAESYDAGGPSSEHTANLLRRAAVHISCLEQEVNTLRRQVRDAIDIKNRYYQEAATLRRQVETARADACEEAAKIADLSAYYNGSDESRREVAATIAREIRALKSLKTEG